MARFWSSRSRLPALGAFLFLAVATDSVRAQDTLPRAPSVDSAQALTLFLDCRAPGCDFNYLRTELTWVNYVRDRTASQVHVIATAIGTGSGGLEVTLKFIGREAFTGVTDEIKYHTQRGATGDELREELARVLKAGLVRYAVRTRFGRNITVGYVTGSEGGALQEPKDPWNFWVFSVGLSASLGGESRSNGRSGSGSVYASRTTAAWKFRASASGSTSRSSYLLADSTRFVARSHSYSTGSVLVRSVNDHLSLGAGFGLSASSQNNLNLALRVAPTVEFDVFKYDQYTRRRLVASYSIGLDRYHYTDTTIFNRIRETRMDQQLSLSYAATQPWGSANVGISGSSYLSDFSQNRLSFYTSMSLRVTRGLSVSYSFSYSRVRDQLSLAKSTASEAEILLKLRQLATSYTYGGSFSLNYTFGSLFNNVVNPRMGF